MRKITIVRYETSDSGTFGQLSTDSGFQCYTGELPNRNNKPERGCILPDSYEVKLEQTKKHGLCYRLKDKHGRTAVLFHKGNFCGDIDKGLKTDVEGCIILGNAVGEIGGQKALLSSKDAFERFMADLEKESFELIIKEKYT